MTTTQRRALFAALIISTTIKLYLAIVSHGTTDVDAFKDHLDKVREFGVKSYHYRGVFDNPFNSPPPMVHVIKALGWLTDFTDVSFGFWLRLFPILAGIGSFFLVWRLLKDRSDLFPLLLALGLCPISVMVDGYHGNTDSVVIFFVLLSLYLIQERGLYAYALAGFAFGLACCVKVVPMMFVPAFLLYLPNMKARVQFAATSAGLFLIASMPFIVQDPIAVKNTVFGYGSIYGAWGIPQLAAIVSNVRYVHPPFEPLGVHAIIAGILKYVSIALMIVLPMWMNCRRNRPSLFMQCGVIAAMVLLLAPGFGPQYLVWLVPFAPAFGLKSTLTYYIPASLYLAYKYTGLVDYGPLVPLGFVVALCCWLSLALILSERYRLNWSAN